MARRLVQALLLVAALGTAVAMLRAQQYYYWGYPSRVEPGDLPEERTGFTFCRLFYTSVRTESGGSGWNTDFPMADENLMVRLAELTKTEITRFEDGAPAHALLRATDPQMFECPFLFASDVGTVGFDTEEIEALRQYLLKGGFLWVDDFWGSRAWSEWTREIQTVLPEYSIVELPPDHSLYSTFYSVEQVPQIPSIQHWRRSGGQTSERGPDSDTPRMHGIFDEHNRLLVLMSHNTDIADGWEREGEDQGFFHSFSPYGYAVGINVAMWAMTH